MDGNNVMKCRICLSFKRKLVSIFNTVKNIPKFYANIIIRVTNVKVLENDGITDGICSSCCKKLNEVYKLKTLIEKSHNILQKANNHNFKIIHYDDFNDVKLELDYEYDKKHCINDEDNSLKFSLLNVTNSLCYKDITIKKVNNDNVHVLNEPVPVLDFLKTVKQEDINGQTIFDFNDSDYAELPLICKRVKKQFQKKSIASKDKQYKKEHCKIKPVLLEDIRIVSSIKKFGKRRPKKNNHNINRERICPYCGKITKSMKSHLFVHTGERKFKCDECASGFFTLSQLNSHKRKHINARDFKCGHCIAAFNNKGSLQRHIESHTDVRSYVCDVCKKAFKRKSGLFRHTLIHNSANKTINCEMCNMSFVSIYSLQHHKRVHTGERPYNCEICSQPYSYKHDFNRHCMKKHGVFLKRRSVRVMNQQVLVRERILMKQLFLRTQGIIKEGEPLNPLEGVEEGAQAALAFQQAMKSLAAIPIPTILNL